MSIAIGPYKHRQQPFQLNDIAVIMNTNTSDFDLVLFNSICQRNHQFQHIHIATLPSKEIELILGCDFAKLVTPTEAISSKQDIQIG